MACSSGRASSGTSSIAAWLAQRCGPSGHVLVTGIDERFLVQSAALNQPMIEIQRHDIVTDPLPARRFDLIHERLVLFHVPAGEQALERMVTALKPGGWVWIQNLSIYHDVLPMSFHYNESVSQGTIPGALGFKR